MDIDFLKILNSVWQVLAIGLLFGAGLPVLFALGMRSLTAGRVTADGTVISGGQTTGAGRAGAAICFGLTVAAALFGIVIIVWGKQIFGS